MQKPETRALCTVLFQQALAVGEVGAQEMGYMALAGAWSPGLGSHDWTSVWRYLRPRGNMTEFPFKGNPRPGWR